MTPTHALAAILVGASLALLSACAQLFDREEAPTPPPAAVEPRAGLTDYQRCVAACETETPGQRPVTRSAGTLRGTAPTPGSIANQPRTSQVVPLRAAQAQCLSACDALRPPTN
jgi:hypothetical protein